MSERPDPKIRLPEDGLNGLSDDDVVGEFSEVEEADPEYVIAFNSRRRWQDDDGLWHYYVTPVDPRIENLDFIGKNVLINDSVRPCKDFYFDDYQRIVIVTESG